MGSWTASPIHHLHRWLPHPSSSSASIPAAALVAVRSRWSTNQERPRLLSVETGRCSSSSARHQTADTQHQEEEEDVGIMCEPCNGRGWLLCDLCEGQKTNVMAENNRIYRRCPTCRATGYILCSKCKVFKCVTFPDYSDGDLSTASV